MSCNYADGLSPYEDKGILGIDEKFDPPETVDSKCVLLTEWISQAKYVVVHTGAGISTAAGIPDFRGPNGVWTLESKGLKPSINVSFDDAAPTNTHMALKKLLETGYVKFIVTQNIDGLHLRSGVPRSSIAELHGNMFTEKCNTCDRQFVRNQATTSVGERCLGEPCPGLKANSRPCRGKLHDTILDWEANLPSEDLDLADYHSHIADLNICLGTTLQIVPSGNLPLKTLKYGGKVVIVNLQPTKHDKKANLLIHTFVDDVLKKVMKRLGLEIPEYTSDSDPTKNLSLSRDWTLSSKDVKIVKKMFEETRGKKRSGQIVQNRIVKKIKPESLKSEVISEAEGTENV